MWLFAPQIIRIATNQGELVIETEDENVQVEIRENGDLIRVLDASSGASFDVRSGNFEISAISKDGKAEFQVKPNQLLMSRGDREVVRVTLAKSAEVPSAQHAGSTASPSSRLAGPATDQEPVASAVAEAPDIGVYRGRDFAAWMRVLQNDQDPATQAEALNACATLYASAGLYDELSSLLSDYVKRHAKVELRGRGTTSQFGLYRGFNDAFAKLPVEKMVNFLASELKDSTEQAHLLWAYRTVSSVGDPKIAEELNTRGTELLLLCAKRPKIDAVEYSLFKDFVKESQTATPEMKEALSQVLLRLSAPQIFSGMSYLPEEWIGQELFDQIKKELFSKDTSPVERDEILKELLVLSGNKLREKHIFVKKLIAEVIANQLGPEPIKFDRYRRMKVYANSLDVEQATEFKRRGIFGPDRGAHEVEISSPAAVARQLLDKICRQLKDAVGDADQEFYKKNGLESAKILHEILSKRSSVASEKLEGVTLKHCQLLQIEHDIDAIGKMGRGEGGKLSTFRWDSKFGPKQK